MPFDWAEYLRLAEELAQRVTDEAAMRSAISRAYYAGYHFAEIRRKKRGITIPASQGSSHAARWRIYKEHTEPACRVIGLRGDRLREQRMRADYQDTVGNLQNELSAALVTAKNILLSLQALPENCP